MAQVARDLGIPESTLHGWKSQEQKFCATLCTAEEEAHNCVVLS